MIADAIGPMIFGVSELTGKIRSRLETGFPFVWVRGEITNISRPPSGHIYFSLKDEQSQLQCVWFAAKKKDDAETFDPLTGEVFERPRPSLRKTLRNGMEILCCGSITVYEARGQYQLLVELAQTAGDGRLAQEFEERKIRMAALGFFKNERKRTLPRHPARIALITSPHGAAIHDFMRMAHERGLPSTIRLFPVPVQGAEAAAKIAGAIELAGSQDWAELIVLIRGGGSLEDLWAFNEDIVAQAVFKAKAPVVAGIGHEVDFSLADLTADVRAATPTHAAQIIWPLRSEIVRRIDELDMDSRAAMNKIIARLENRLRLSVSALNLLSPVRKLLNLENRRKELAQRAYQAALNWHQKKTRSWRSLDTRIRNVQFLKEKIRYKDEKIQWLASQLHRALREKIRQKIVQTTQSFRKLPEKGRAFLEMRETRLERMDINLRARNPLAPLSRGYALVFGKNGLVRSRMDCAIGSNLTIQIEDGLVDVKVIKTKPFTGNANDI